MNNRIRVIAKRRSCQIPSALHKRRKIMLVFNRMIRRARKIADFDVDEVIFSAKNNIYEANKFDLCRTSIRDYSCGIENLWLYAR